MKTLFAVMILACLGGVPAIFAQEPPPDIPKAEKGAKKKNPKEQKNRKPTSRKDQKR